VLEGKNLNLRIMEKEDLPLLAKWNNDPEFGGEYESLDQSSHFALDKWFSNLQPNEQWFIIEKKDGTRIGQIFCTPKGAQYVIGYRILQNERNKGYCTEAVKIMLDYLFLSKNIVRIESETNPKNTPSSRVLEKAGFTREGIIRKSVFIRGAWHDGVLYSILREEWREPKILTKTSEIWDKTLPPHTKKQL
jgi:RimJ/RimL family protein N-acetyltransferase